jgi:hypothetical protein
MQIAAGLERRICGKNREIGIANLIEGQKLFRQAFVLLQVRLARSASRVAQAHYVHQTQHSNIAEQVLPKHLQQVEDEVGRAVAQAGDQLIHVVMNAQHRWFVTASA